MDLKDLIKTYRVINDPKLPKVSIKFGGLLLLAGLWGIVVFLLVTGGNPATAPPPANTFYDGSGARGSAAAEGTESTSYIGYDPLTFDPSLGYDVERVTDAVASWRSAHPHVSIVRQEIVTKDGLVIGFTLHFERAEESGLDVTVPG